MERNENCGVEAGAATLYAWADRRYGLDHSDMFAQLSDTAKQAYFQGIMKDESALSRQFKNAHGGSPIAQKFISKHPYAAMEYIQNPDFILGPEYVDYHRQLIKEWHQEVIDGGHAKDIGEQKRLYNEIVVPEVREAIKDVQDGIEDFEGGQRRYALQYLKDLEDGLTVFGPPDLKDPIRKLKSGIVSGVMKWNPLTAMMHITSLQRTAGLTDFHILKGLLKTAQTGIHDKAINREMVYGAGSGHGGGLVGVSDNLIKTVTYHAAMSKYGDKAKAYEMAHRASMAIDPANCPTYFRDRGSLFQLIRFEIEGQKYNAQNMFDLMHGAKTGNKQKAVQAGIALATSASAYYLLGGRQAFVPKIVSMFMPKEDMEDAEELPGEAIITKALNLDLVEKLQPIGGDFLGITTRMLVDNARSVQGSLKKGFENMEDNPEASHQAFLDAFVKSSLFWGSGLSAKAGQAIGGFPGLVTQTIGEIGTGINGQRAYKSYKDMIRNDEGWDYYLKRFAEKTIPLRNALTPEGENDIEFRHSQKF